MGKRICIFVCVCLIACLALPNSSEAAVSKRCRDCSCLSEREQTFAQQLSVHKRRVFCGKFSSSQRIAAMQYTQRNLSADEAVVRVMDETGMSLAVKTRKQCGEIANK